MARIQEETRFIRARAEATLASLRATEPEANGHEVDPRAALHELHVHQIELQMQNEALRETQLELERSRERYRDLYERAPISYLTLARDGRILDANETAKAFFGREGGDLVGTRLSSFLSADHVRRFALHRQDVLGGTGKQSCGVDLIVSGQRREVRLESVCTHAATGEWQTAAFDMTDARRLENSLREHALLVDILDAAGFLVVLDAHGRVLLANYDCQHELCGEHDVSGRAFWELFSAPSERARVEHTLTTLRSTGSRHEWEATCTTAAGEQRVISWFGTPLRNASGVVEHVIAHGTDLTERKRLESQLVVADRLAAMGTLAAGIGHEINNPLAYAMLSLERARSVLEREPFEQARGEVKRLLDTACEGTARIRGIVADLRSLARGDDAAAEAIDVHPVLDSCIQIASHTIRHRARLVREYGKALEVRANASRLGQVFLNLLVNAAHAIPEGRADENTIVVRTSATRTGAVLIEISDTGRGIAKSELGRLFDPFFTTKLDRESSGLGLSICHSIISSLHGSIAIDSTVGRGTLVRVTIPGAAAAEHDTHAAIPLATGAAKLTQDDDTQSVAPAAPLHILILDDEVQLAKTLACLLDGHSVDLATSGSDALARCREHAYDLILCDVLMPDLTGMEFRERLEQVRPGAEKRIIFITGGAFSERAQAALDRVPNGVLHKPFTIPQIWQAMAQHGIA